MGTNYYWRSGEKCDKCGHAPGKPLHIGKSSGGWCFSLHVTRPGDKYPDDDGAGNVLPSDLDGWRALFGKPGSHIEDEYGDAIAPDEMIDCITNRSRPGPAPEHGAQWYAMNCAEPGPRGLVRRSDKWEYGTRHGRPGPVDATYDYCYGEFS